MVLGSKCLCFSSIIKEELVSCVPVAHCLNVYTLTVSTTIISVLEATFCQIRAHITHHSISKLWQTLCSGLILCMHAVSTGDFVV